jgi:lysophospholipid hydrolase
MYSRILNSGAVPDVHSDFSRLARMVTGTSVGLVLGGGGARGCSHVGMIKAILESGIPIDSVAGVSIGSLIGALWCQERDLTEMTLKARQFAMKMTQRWRQALDLTYPYTAYFSGRVFNSLIEELFGDRDISDLWLPYLTITTDLTLSAMRVHDYGSLWRYVRGSMSLAGYMPPICDPHDGHLLVDGGYVNNLPADISRTRLKAKHVLAVDVGAQDDVSFTNYGDWVSRIFHVVSLT